MNKLITAIERTGQQLFDRPFLKVLLLGMLTTVGAILVTFLISNEVLKELPLYQSDWDWWQDIVNSMAGYIFNAAFVFTVVLFFAPISTIFISIFLDDVIDCVEDRFYPENRAGKRLGIPNLAFLAVRIMFLIIVLNILMLPIYVLLFWIPFVPLAIFYLLNGYLLGWGYYEMVAVRHLGIKEAGVHRKSIRGVILCAGLIMTLLFMVPIVNFTVPILGAALICHLFHLSRSEET